MEKIQNILRLASVDIHSGNLENAAKLLNPLKDEYPLSPEVARLWCLLARRTGKADAVPAYAARVYAHVEGDVHKARWAQIMGTANFISLNLESAHENFTCALEHLLALIKMGRAPTKKKQRQPDNENLFSSGKAEQLLWATCAQLAAHEIQAFPYAGTLLGLVRNDALLEFDKDLDIAVWVESLDDCCAVLEMAGWVRVKMGIDYSNYRDYCHIETGITLDVCAIERQSEQRVVGGFSLPDHPEAYQRVSVFPAIILVPRETDYGKVWFPQQPEVILQAFYGDWRTPNPNWDTVVSAQNLENYTLLVRCYAYYRLLKHWLAGDLVKAWCYAQQIALKDADDVLILRCRQWIEQTMTRLGQKIPVWPQNLPGRRIYTRMVADLFHEGHVNFLREARALGSHLTVCVVPDERVRAHKGKQPVMTHAERLAIVSACQYVDEVIADSPVNATLEFMQTHDFAIYTFACASESERLDKYKQCALLPAEMIHEIDYTPGISTSDLVARVLHGAGGDHSGQTV